MLIQTERMTPSNHEWEYCTEKAIKMAELEVWLIHTIPSSTPSPEHKHVLAEFIVPLAESWKRIKRPFKQMPCVLSKRCFLLFKIPL